jgi:hypothetical protein
MAYRSNPLDTAKGRSSAYYGQKEMEASKEDGNILVFANAATRKVGNATGAGVDAAETRRGVVAPWDDKAGLMMSDLIGR